jgi:excisionase family DNA binding protein
VAWNEKGTSVPRRPILLSSLALRASPPLRDPACGARFRLTAPGPQSDASNNKFRPTRIARSAVASRGREPKTVVAQRRSSGKLASVDGRVGWLATHGPRHPSASSGTEAFAENVAQTARGIAPRGSMSALCPRPRVERSAQLPKTTSRPRTCGHARRTYEDWLTVAEGAEYAGVSRDRVYTACERGELHHARIGGRRARLKTSGSTNRSNGTREVRRSDVRWSRRRCAVAYRNGQKGGNDGSLQLA